MISRTEFRLKELKASLGLSKAPPLSVLIDDQFAPSPEGLVEGRDELLERLLDEISDWSQSNTGQVALVCGPPGVGKSTMMRCLHAQMEKTAVYVSITDISTSIFNREDELPIDRYVWLLSSIESKIIELDDYRDIWGLGIPNSQNFLISGEDYESDFEILVQYFVESLRSINNKISTRYKQWPVNILIDNSDFISKKDQDRLFHIISGIYQSIPHATIILAARPYLVHQVTSDPRGPAGSMGDILAEVKAVPISPVVKARVKSVSVSGDDSFVLDDEGYSYIDTIIDGNLAFGLKLISKLYSNSPYNLRSILDKYKNDEIIECLVREGVVDSYSPGNEVRYFHNIAERVRHKDYVSAVFALICTINTHGNINRETTEYFNNLISADNPRQEQFRLQEIEEIADTLRKQRLIRRTGPYSKFSGQPFGITATGKFTIELLFGNQSYRDAINYDNMNFRNRNFVEKNRPKRIKTANSRAW